MVLGYPNVNNKSEGSTYYPEKKAGIPRLRISNAANMVPSMLVSDGKMQNARWNTVS